MTAPRRSDWLVIPRPVERPRARLLCFPYAGGGALVYRTWSQRLPADVELVVLQLPGRERRLREPLFTRMAPLIDALEPVVAPCLTEIPCALFGHSMGGLIAYELCTRLRQRGADLPDHLIISGRPAPQHYDPGSRTFALPDAEFIGELRRHGGTPEQVLDHPELMELLLPILRADFELIETCPPREQSPLELPITALAGEHDEIAPPAEVTGWREHTARTFSFHTFAGGHFFLHHAEAQVVAAVTAILSALGPSRT